MTVPLTKEALSQLLAEFRGRRAVLLPMLHRVQEEYGYIPEVAVEVMAGLLGTSASLIYGAITFYSEFRLAPPPRVLLRICQGPACYLRGAKRLERIVSALTGLTLGQQGRLGDQAPDGSVGFELEQCPGLCTLAPFVRINGQLQGNLRAAQLQGLLKEVLSERGKGSGAPPSGTGLSP